MPSSRRLGGGQLSRRTTTSSGMDYLQSLPRRWVTIYIPLGIFVFVLLFPFYWMVVTSVKPNDDLLSRDANPFWTLKPTLAHFHKLLFETPYPEWLWNTVVVSVGVHRGVAGGGGARRLCDRTAALPGRQARRRGDLPRLPGAAVDPVHPAVDHHLPARPVRHAHGADPVVPDVPDPVLHLAADGLLPLDPVRARGVRADRRRDAAGRSSSRSCCRWRCRA